MVAAFEMTKKLFSSVVLIIYIFKILEQFYSISGWEVSLQFFKNVYTFTCGTRLCIGIVKTPGFSLLIKPKQLRK